MKRFGLVLLYCLKVKTEQQNAKRHGNTKYSKGSGTAKGGGGVKRFSLSEANREGVYRSVRYIFLFHFFFSLFFNCFTLSYAFLPDYGA